MPVSWRRSAAGLAREIVAEFIQADYYRDGGRNENVDVEITGIGYMDFRMND